LRNDGKVVVEGDVDIGNLAQQQGASMKGSSAVLYVVEFGVSLGQK
jgi:hypothetical protein